MQLTEVEAVFRTLKSKLNLRPIFHRIQSRVEAHILIAFLAYCLWVCLKQKLRSLGGSLTPAQVLHTLKQILMVEVWFDLRRGGQICLPRITQPEAPAQLILHRLGWSLPEQPPPRIYLTRQGRGTAIELTRAREERNAEVPLTLVAAESTPVQQKKIGRRR